MDMKRIFLCAIVIAAMTLAGCGGGGGTDPMTGGNGNGGPNPAAQLTALLTALTDAGLTVTADSTAADIMAQLTTMSNNAREAALATIRAALGLTGMEDATAIANAITTRLGRVTPAPTAKTNAVLGAIVAPMTAGDPSTARGVNYTGRPGNETAQDDVVFVRAGNTTTNTAAAIFVGDPAAIADADQLDKVEMMDDPDSNDPMDMVPVATNFMEDGSAMTVGSGFTSQVYKRTTMDGDQTDEINVYTNMEDPKSQAFNVFYVQDNIANRDGVSAVVTPSVDAADTATTNVDETKFHVLLALTTADDFSDLFDAAEFRSSSTETGVETLTYGPATDTVNQHRRKFEGMFNGVAGTFTCGDVTGGTACTASLSGGKLTALTSGNWQFTPDDPKSTIADVDHDSDFLAFGWWLRSVTDEDDETTYSVGTFAEGAVVYTVANAQDLVGTASYSGPAAGKYGRKQLNADGTLRGLDVGHFTADASLMAYFGGGDVAANKHDTISGSVTNFRDGNGNMIDSAWTVELMKAGFAPSGDNARDTNLAAETFGGATTGKGDWQGRFYGPHGVVVDDTTTTAIDERMMEYPTGVAGEFTGHFSNGHVIGAFGATKD